MGYDNMDDWLNGNRHAVITPQRTKKKKPKPKTNIDKLVRELKEKCVRIEWCDAGLMGDYERRTIDYQKLSDLLIRELKKRSK